MLNWHVQEEPANYAFPRSFVIARWRFGWEYKKETRVYDLILPVTDKVRFFEKEDADKYLKEVK